MIQSFVFTLVVAIILIFAAFLWILYLIKLVSNEEELNERIRARQRRREEQLRKKTDQRKKHEDDKKKGAESRISPTEPAKNPEANAGIAGDNSKQSKTEVKTENTTP